MASKNDVVAYLRDKIVDSGYVVETSYYKGLICVTAQKDGTKTPQMCSKSELFAFSKLFYYIFIQEILKKDKEKP